MHTACDTLCRISYYPFTLLFYCVPKFQHLPDDLSFNLTYFYYNCTRIFLIKMEEKNHSFINHRKFLNLSSRVYKTIKTKLLTTLQQNYLQC